MGPAEAQDGSIPAKTPLLQIRSARANHGKK
jgi:hypothetical protein